MMKKTNFENFTIERDVSWMFFNHRILEEAQKKSVPLLERLSFLGIYSNNLDEFFRVRMASLNRFKEYAKKQSKSEYAKICQTLKIINTLNKQYAKEYEQIILQVQNALKAEKIFLLKEMELNGEQQEFIQKLYYEKLSGYISPVWLNTLKGLSNTADDCVHLVVQADEKFALMELPVSKFGRFIRLPDKNDKICLMYLDDVVRVCLPYVFQGMGFKTFSAYSFKFTKDAEIEIDNDFSTGFVQEISKGVKNRKKGEPIRVLYDSSMPKKALEKLLEKLKIDNLDTVLASGRYQNHKDLIRFPDCGRKDLKYPLWQPIRKKEFESESMLQLVSERDRFIHVPYHSFDSYIQLLREAAIHPEIKSIKTTLYRLAKDSQVIQALMCAAQNGKKVTVIIELLARFDETSNINWGKKMNEAGIRVIYGVQGLKIHSKITYIESKQKSVAVISTGNFHEGNAKVYTDFLMMTSRKNIVSEVAKVFDFIERPYKPVKFKELIVSPNDMRKKLLHLIDVEIKNKREGKNAYILGKINHVVDLKIIKKLYEASNVGVSIQMLVRGNSSVMTGIPGVSENIRFQGIIDRYLEHSRILIFCNGGDEKYFIGSADWMPRNFDKRIEVLAPVYDALLKQDLKRIVSFGLKDSKQGRIVDGSGKNSSVENSEGKNFRSQEKLYDFYKKENK